MPDSNPVQRAIDALGGVLATQVKLNIGYWRLHNWVKRGMVPSTRYAVALSEACEGLVTVKELGGALPNGKGDADADRALVASRPPRRRRRRDRPRPG